MVASLSGVREGFTAAARIQIQDQQQSHLIESDQGNAAAEAFKEDPAMHLQQLEDKSSSKS